MNSEKVQTPGEMRLTYNIQETAKRIRTLRIGAGYTQEALADALKVDRSYIGHVERGKRGCSIDVLVRMAELFQVSLDYLITGSEPSSERLRAELDYAIQQLTELRDSL